MERMIEMWTRFLLEMWQNATLVDYMRLALSIVVAAWFFGWYGKQATSR